MSMHYFVENYELRRVSLPPGVSFFAKNIFFGGFVFVFLFSNRYLHWRNSVAKFRLEIYKYFATSFFGPNFDFLVEKITTFV